VTMVLLAVMEISANHRGRQQGRWILDLKQFSHRSNRRSWNRSVHDERKATLDCAGTG
jgi:hypothetical protein